MCGITGFINNDNVKEKEIDIKKMSKRIEHRGPDSEGTFITEDIALGFRRLSIIDLKGGSQPIFSQDKSKVIIFNGEIYNYKELKKDLIDLGYSFKTESDTEVILVGYIHYKEKIVNMLRGMFAFVIYDINDKSLFGARDHFGIKPFYYAVMDNTFMFSSEIKSFLGNRHFNKELNKDALRPYLTFQYNALDETFFKGVFKLLPGNYFIYKNNKLSISEYYDEDFKEINKPFSEYINEVNDVIKSSVEYHSISDVKVGSFLSGGVDSSYITTLLHPDNTFSVGFENIVFNEVHLAEDLSKLIDVGNKSKIITPEEFFNVLENVQYYSDEPHANLSNVPLYFLSDLTKDYVKVVLSGEGADELFAGYELYENNKVDDKYKRLPKAIRYPLGKVGSLFPYIKGHNFLIRNGLGIEQTYIGQAFIFDEFEKKHFLNKEYLNGPLYTSVTKPYFDKVKDKDDLIKKQYLDMHLWLPNDILLKADKMTMAHSLELRVPFLDKEVMALAQDLPSEYKITPTSSKYILREAANKVLPDEWATRKKKGFPVPFSNWIREEKYYNVVRSTFLEDYVNEFFNQKYILKLLDDHYNNKKNNGRKVWTIYCFLLWYKVYFINEK